MQQRILIALCLVCLALPVQAFERPLAALAPDLGVSGSFRVGLTEFSGDRVTAEITLSAPALWAELDRLGQDRGNLGSSRNRLYWVGPTRLLGVDDAGGIRLRSRARYESWTIARLLGSTLKNKNFQDTKTIDFSLAPVWAADEKALSLRYRLDNIRNLPGEVEDWLQALGTSFGGAHRLAVSDHAAFAALDPQIHRWRARPLAGDAGLAFDIELSVDRAFLMSEIAQRLGLTSGVRNLVGGAVTLLGWGR